MKKILLATAAALLFAASSAQAMDLREHEIVSFATTFNFGCTTPELTYPLLRFDRNYMKAAQRIERNNLPCEVFGSGQRYYVAEIKEARGMLPPTVNAYVCMGNLIPGTDQEDHSTPCLWAYVDLD